jgi:threonine dehydrogenase-like Zn-dependent dehydrogenase
MAAENHNLYAQLTGPHDLQLFEELLPDILPHPNYVRLKVDYCSICGGDITSFLGKSKAIYPITLGHEYFGRIERIGEEVTDLHVGDHVAVDPNYRCGECAFCNSGNSHFCESSGVNLFHPRGFSRYVDIHHSYLYKIPEFPEIYLGSLIEPLSCALHALKLSKVNENDKVLILGCGGQGTLLTFALSVFFPKLKIDLFDPNSQRAFNLTSVFTETTTLYSESPASPDYSLVFEASGQSGGFDCAVETVQAQGRIIIISRYNNGKVKIPCTLARRGCSIKFSHLNGDGNSFIRAMHLLSTQWSDHYNKLFRIVPFRDLREAFKQIENSPNNKTIAAISNGS